MMKSNIKSFLPLERLGQGSFASVYKVKRISDDQIYALKKIKMGKLCKKQKDNALNQVRLLASLNCPYITTYYQAFFDEKLDALCIVMQYASKGDLRKMICQYQRQKKVISELDIWKVMIHLLYGLRVLHNNNILHRDLKCENIFAFDNFFKIGDMNVSKINKKGFVETQTGTPYYASPQVWKDEPYNQKSDIWSLGCILYEMATLNPPFRANNMHQLYKKITQSTFKNIPQCYSYDLSSIISHCLSKSPGERPTVQQLLSHLTVKLYENICVSNLTDRMLIKQAEKSINLLRTINFPNNIRQLNTILPQSNYKTADKRTINIQKHLQFKSIVHPSQRRNSGQLKKSQQVLIRKTNCLQQQEQAFKVQDFNQSNNIVITKGEPAQLQNQVYQMQRIIDRINIKSNKDAKYVIEFQGKQQNNKLLVKQRRILKGISNSKIDNVQRKSRSRSLPRTQKRLRSISIGQIKDARFNRVNPQFQIENGQIKGLSNQKVKDNEKIIKSYLMEDRKVDQSQKKNRYVKVIELAKKCMERGHSRKCRMFY